MNQHKINHLVLSGGGLLGISYIGLFKYCEEHNTLSNIKIITGCSAGAIFGSLLAIGYNNKELDVIVKSMVFKDYLKINVDSILNFVNTKGLESGKKLHLFIKNCIKDKTGDENITFKQVQDKYNIKLQIGVTNLTKSKFELLNVNTTPNVSIIQAISASIAIPFLFEPIIIGDDIYCDGGILDNLPIESDEYGGEEYGGNEPDANETNINIVINSSETETTEKLETADTLEKTDKLETEEKLETADKLDTIESSKSVDSINKKELFNVIGFYLINKSHNIDKNNYNSIPLSQYINVITHTLSKNLIYKKNKTDNNKKKNYKIITIEIPCDIMTFIKLNATHDDINNIIDIAYNITKKEIELN